MLSRTEYFKGHAISPCSLKTHEKNAKYNIFRNYLQVYDEKEVLFTDQTKDKN